MLDEDIFATEEIEKIILRSEQLLPELMIRSDTTTVEGRRILQRMMDLESQAGLISRLPISKKIAGE